MLIELFIFYEVIVIGLFTASFFTKQEILWALTSVMSGVLMFTSYHIEIYVYQFNSTIGAYSPVAMSHSYPYLMAINFLFFALALVIGMFDLFEKYGMTFAGKLGDVKGKFRPGGP